MEWFLWIGWIIKARLSKCFLIEQNSVKLLKIKESDHKNGRLATAHGFLKIHKEFVNLPKFRPIGDTTRIVHYQLRKHLSELFHPLTYNEYREILSMLLLELKISRKNCLIKVIDLYHLMLHPYLPTSHYKKPSTLY